nr:MAG TPA: hypothetical protein [Caudoviricetes sp.]DAK84228.1 MAG TPA: hypothetical protein [Caudoviricetes sp.]
MFSSVFLIVFPFGDYILPHSVHYCKRLNLQKKRLYICRMIV